MDEKTQKFINVALKPDIKREIDMIAASEQRPRYDVVADMLAAYKIAQAQQRSAKPAKPSRVIAQVKQ